MSGDEARPNQTETAKYLANFISGQFNGNTINLGNGQIKFTDYTLKEAAPNPSIPVVELTGSSGAPNNGVYFYLVPTGSNTLSEIDMFNGADTANSNALFTGISASNGYIGVTQNGTATEIDFQIVTDAGTWTFGSTVANTTLPGIVSSYNGKTTAGQGLATVLASSTQNAVTNAAPATVSLTPASAVGTYRISGYLNVTTGTTIAAALNITYKDPQGNARNDGVVFQKAGSATLLTSVVTTGQQTFQETIAIDNSGTAITVADNSGTYTTCVYDLAVVIERLA